MRIVLLNDDGLSNARGGAAIIANWLRAELAGRGHDVAFITTHQQQLDTPMVHFTDKFGEVVSIYSNYPLQQRHSRCVNNHLTAAPLRLLLHRIRPDAVHAHNIHTHLGYQALGFASESTKNVILTAHDTFMVSYHRVGGEGYLRAASEGRAYKMKLLDHLKVAGRRYRPMRNTAIKKILGISNTKVVAISHAVGSFLSDHGITPATVIHNGVPMRLDPPASLIEEFRTKQNLNGPTVLFAGRVSHDKGMGALLSAMELVLRKLPTAHILVAGELAAMEPFMSRAHESVRKAVRVTGWLEPADMPLVYASCDVVATPSLYLDNFPTVNLEAMAAGKPVIGTKFGGTPEAVQDGVTGFIIDPREADAFAARLLMLLQDGDARRRMGEEGRDRVRKDFTLQGMAKQYERLYRGETI
jgi:glycosyltransferase involved in cell wall biosynthesis